MIKISIDMLIDIFKKLKWDLRLTYPIPIEIGYTFDPCLTFNQMYPMLHFLSVKAGFDFDKVMVKLNQQTMYPGAFLSVLEKLPNRDVVYELTQQDYEEFAFVAKFGPMGEVK